MSRSAPTNPTETTRLDLSDNSRYETQDAISISGWIRGRAADSLNNLLIAQKGQGVVGSTANYLVGFGAAVDGLRSFRFLFNQDGPFGLNFFDSTEKFLISPTRTWQAFAVSMQFGDGDAILMAKDGRDISAGTWDGDKDELPLNSGEVLSFGNATSATGEIAEVAIWTAKLSIGELISVTSGTSPLRIRPKDLQSYCPLFGGPQVLGGDDPDYAGFQERVTSTAGLWSQRDHPPVAPMFGFAT